MGWDGRDGGHGGVVRCRVASSALVAWLVVLCVPLGTYTYTVMHGIEQLVPYTLGGWQGAGVH